MKLYFGMKELEKKSNKRNVTHLFLITQHIVLEDLEYIAIFGEHEVSICHA